MKASDSSSSDAPNKGVSRRGFLAVAGGSVAAASFLNACGEDSSASAETGEFGDGDVGILNYLLTLEYVLADFYKGLTNSTLFNEAERAALGEFGEQEEKHAEALVRQIEKADGEPAPKPKTKFELRLNAATLELASKLENAIAAAYLGQLPKVDSDDLRAKLLEIHSVEGRHAAAMEYLQGKPVTPDGSFAKPATVKETMAVMKPYIRESAEA
ncbi:MAG: ferritin-like domain-containing protein [Solirubrobacterales bacterium]